MNTVYLIENTVNGKLYVGVTGQLLKERIKQHFTEAKANQERALQNAIRKYGKSAFEIHPLQDAESKEEAYELEKQWIELLNTYEEDHGYNMTRGGKGTGRGENHPMYGTSLSENTKQKMSHAHKGRTFSKEHRQKLSKVQKEREFSEEHKRKISETLKNQNTKHRTKLTRKEAGEIKWLYANTGMSQREISEKYPVSRGTVSRVTRESSWANVKPINPND